MPLTRVQLLALPERKETEVRLLSEEEAKLRGGRLGDSELVRIPPRFCSYKIKGDDILIFHDEEGAWAVDHHLEGGPYKRRFYL